MTLEEYASITYYHYSLKCKGFFAARLDDWKRTRELAFVTMTSSANADPKKLKGLTPEKWWPLEGKQEEKKKVTPIHKRKNFKEMLNRFKNVKR